MAEKHTPWIDTRIMPIPLREDVTVYIAMIPNDLTRPEALKIGRVILALATGDTP